MVEAFGYPFVKGDCGIPFEEIPLGYEGTIETGSGRELKVKLGRSKVYISEFPYLLSANVSGEDSVVRMSLSTVNHRRERHPDFFASKFLAFALNHFEHNGYNIKLFRAQWDDQSDNWIEYMNNRDRGAKRTEAAFDTWTGKQLSRHGFNKVRSIRTNNNSGIMDVIFARE